MVKKIVLGTLLVGLVGLLVVGAAIRTMDKTGNVAEARGAGQGKGNSESVGLGAEGSAQGQQGGYRQGAAAGDESGRQYPNFEGTPDEEWVLYEGQVIQVPAAGVDMVIETEDGLEVVVGTGPGYMEAQGFSLQAGEQVQVQGYWENDEFKAIQVTRLRDGQSIVLRDAAGHPAWAGSGRRGAEEQAVPGAGGRGRGEQGQGGRGRGGF